jgi:hypothetical protein
MSSWWSGLNPFVEVHADESKDDEKEEEEEPEEHEGGIQPPIASSQFPTSSQFSCLLMIR